MIPFRESTPKRRDIKTIVSKYSEHRDDLKLDFKSRCGYCDDADLWRTVWFEIDHFVPQKYLKTIKDTDYSNLVYACRSCNNSKRAHWPSGDENIHYKNNEGFMDPCFKGYDEQFERTLEGKILYKTELGKWMYFKLKLHKPQHEIIWKIEQLDKLIEECKLILEKNDKHIHIKDRMLKLCFSYIEYTKKLGSL